MGVLASGVLVSMRQRYLAVAIDNDPDAAKSRGFGRNFPGTLGLNSWSQVMYDNWRFDLERWSRNAVSVHRGARSSCGCSPAHRTWH